MRVWLKRTGQVDGTSWREQKVLCVVNAGSKMGVPLVYLSMWGRRVTSTSSPLAHRVNTTSRFSSMLGKKGDKYIVSTNAQILSISGRTVFPVSPASVADVLFQGIPDWRRGDRGCSSLSLRMCKWPIKPSSSRASLLVGPASFVQHLPSSWHRHSLEHRHRSSAHGSRVSCTWAFRIRRVSWQSWFSRANHRELWLSPRGAEVPSVEVLGPELRIISPSSWVSQWWSRSPARRSGGLSL